VSIFFRPMGCAASTDAVEPVKALVRDIASKGRGDVPQVQAREADYIVPVDQPYRLGTSVSAASICSEIFAGGSPSLDTSKWAEARRPSHHSPPPHSGVRVKAKGNPGLISARKFPGSFGSFQEFCDLAEQLKIWDQAPDPSVGPPLPF